GVGQLLPVGPGHLAELREDLAEELLRALQIPHVVLTLSVSAWQGWRDSNPHPPDLESGALAVRATPLLRLFVRRMFAAPPTVLLQLETVGMGTFVLRRRVVPPLARRARESDDLAHLLLRDLRGDAGAHRPPPLPDRKPQHLLHRHRPVQLDSHPPLVARHHHHHPSGWRYNPLHSPGP